MSRKRFFEFLKGFTLIEAMIPIAVISVLAVIALPKLFSYQLQARTRFYREVITGLRYAQKMAMATQCPVQFSLTAITGTVGFVLNQVPVASACVPGTFTQTLIMPGFGNQLVSNGGQPYQVTASTNNQVTLTMTGCSPYTNCTPGAVTAFYFDAWGRPYSSAGDPSLVTLNISSMLITIYPETGFISNAV